MPSNLRIFSSLCTAPLNLEGAKILNGCFLPNEADTRQVLIFPKAEWERIQNSLGSRAREEARILAEKKEQEDTDLRSKAVIEDRPNILVNSVEEALKAHKLHEERKEEERKLLDLEEAQFQAAKRKEVIDQTKTYLYNQTERVKGLHSALLLTEVLKERDAQVEFKKLKSGVNKKKDEEKEHERKEAILKEKEKARQRYVNEQALRRDQLEQIKERKHQADLAKLEDKREGEKLQRLNQLYQLEIQRRKEKEQEKKVEQQRLYHENLHVKKTMKAIEEQKQMEEDDRIKVYLKVKETFAKLVKEKEAEMLRLSQEQQDKMVGQLAAQMSEMLRREDSCVARDIAKKEAEQEKIHREKEAERKAAIESIAEHRAITMKMKEQKEREEKAEAKKELHALMEQSRIYLETEKAKKQRERDAHVEVQKAQIQQMAEKQAKQQQEKQADLDYDAQKEVIALCNEREFQSYAKQIIESESKTTHHLYPLLKASRDSRGLGHTPFS